MKGGPLASLCATTAGQMAMKGRNLATSSHSGEKLLDQPKRLFRKAATELLTAAVEKAQEALVQSIKHGEWLGTDIWGQDCRSTNRNPKRARME